MSSIYNLDLDFTVPSEDSPDFSEELAESAIITESSEDFTARVKALPGLSHTYKVGFSLKKRGQNYYSVVRLGYTTMVYRINWVTC